MTARRRKAYPQLVAIELILVAAAGLLAWYLFPLVGVPHSAAMFAAGVVADRALTLLLRHRNKPLGIRLPVSISMTPAKSKPASGRKS